MTETIVRYFGGPLDGREQDLTDSELIPGTVIRHIYLHEGPKIETLYQLISSETGWEYRLCGVVEQTEVQETRQSPLDPRNP